MQTLKEFLETARPERLPDALASAMGSTAGATFAQLLKRPEVRIEQLAPFIREKLPGLFVHSSAAAAWAADATAVGADRLPAPLRNEMKSVETEIKYAGYLNQQQRAIE